MLKPLVAICLAGLTIADLRAASQPKHGWKVQQRNRDVMFQQRYALYMEPSDFNYEKLQKQRDGGGYDNFLRSNIDNEQDRRNFDEEDGEDHLPFRSYGTAANDAGQSTVKHKMESASEEDTGVNAPGNYIKATPGEPYVYPLRWNNPHSSELEMNIWIMDQKDGPYVIPIAKPSCSGEGYQDNVLTFTVPENFNNVASCTKVGQCVLQVYSHSVESRMYSSGVPILVNRSDGTEGAWNPGTIQDACTDPAWNLQKLRPLCLPKSDPDKNHKTAVVYKARLSSDQYNHAYQNSDFSPYAGQQCDHISRNLQASCILKMAVGNFGELGKHYIQKTAPEARNHAKKLDKKARALIRVYETTTNSIIEAIKGDVANTDVLEAVDAPADYYPCPENWRSHYDNTAGGRDRGKDHTRGFCPPRNTCMCHQDCKAGHGRKDVNWPDAYCAELVPAEREGMQVEKEGSRTARVAPKQTTATCFRCSEVGSITTKRKNTNTYIPSFDIVGAKEVDKAIMYVAPMHLKSGFLTNPDTGKISKKGDTKARLQIYMAVLAEMWTEFKNTADGTYLYKYYRNKYDEVVSEDGEVPAQYKFTYRGPVLKTTTATLSDANGGVDRKFKKLDADGEKDGGYYSASKAWALQAVDTGSSTEHPGTQLIISGKNQIPPVAEPDDQCSTNRVVAGLESVEVALAERGLDMDGLNYDAKLCDDDAAIEALYSEFDEACAAEQDKNASYVCGDYPPLDCPIPGQAGLQKGQMFTNEDTEGTGSMGAGATNLPSAGVLFLSMLALCAGQL